MNKVLRYFLFLVCILQSAMAIALFLQWRFVVNVWPFEGTTPLTFIFLSSIFAAAAASTLWALASKAYGTLAGIALDYITILMPLAVLSFKLAGNGDAGQFVFVGIVSVIGVLFGIGMLLWSLRIPIDTAISMPVLARYAFVFFIVALVIVSVQLILKVPNVIPWKITPVLSVVIGWMFVGAMTYFIYGLIRPSWSNTAGQLAGFLAYDAVLIVPFLKRLPSTPPEHRLGLIIYTAVIVLSGLLAIYYLFMNKPTRLWTQIHQEAA